MKQPTQTRMRATLVLALVLAAAGGPVQAAPEKPTEIGHWITQSGNLEVDIAPCGVALCGTIVRVIQNGAMAGPGVMASVAPAGPSPVGMKILIDLKPVSGGALQGQIYNRGDSKTYNSLVALAGPEQLKVTIYGDTPADAHIQTWQRASATQ
jgi:uncharacterized protein (DUF2147 family)